MTCPYCLQFSKQAAVNGHKTKKTLVGAYWEFEDVSEDTWVPFTPQVSGLLESSYQNWLQDPKMKKMPQVSTGKFLYNVDYGLLQPAQKVAPVSQAKAYSQRIRRVGVTDNPEGISDLKPGETHATIDTSLWKQYKAELDPLHKEAEKLRKETAQLRKEKATLESELQGLKTIVTRQQQESEQMSHELATEREALARLLPELSGIFPGRLVMVRSVPSEEHLAGMPGPGSVGRVKAMENQAAAVEFTGYGVVWLPRVLLEPASDSELLMRPGTRAMWRETGDQPQYGVVCGVLSGDMVGLIDAAGRRQTCRIEDISIDSRARPLDAPLEAGDLVRARGPLGVAEQGCDEVIGMVVQNNGASICVRCLEAESSEHVDVEFDISETRVVRDHMADQVRPGVAVRIRPEVQHASSSRHSEMYPVGIVYATHCDGTSVVDFFGDFGRRCKVALLEVVDPPPKTVDHALLRLLSECLSWQEVRAERDEEGKEEVFQRLISMLPSALAASPMFSPEVPSSPMAIDGTSVDGAVAQWTTVEHGTDMFRFLAATLQRSLLGHRSPETSSSEWYDPPQLSIERIERVQNLALQRSYELCLARCQAAHPVGCTELPDIGALRVTGGTAVPARTYNEFFLWYGASLTEADRICREGFDTSSAVGLRFFEHGSAFAGSREASECLLLVRVLLGECLAVVANSGASFSTHRPYVASGRPGPAGERSASPSFDSVRVLPPCSSNEDAPTPQTEQAGEREETVDYPEYIVYSAAQALPLFRLHCHPDAS